MANLRPDKDKPTIVSVSIFPADKGLYSAVPAALIKQEYLNQSRNLIHTTHGSRRTRPGIEPYYLSGFGAEEHIKLLFDHWRNNGGVKNQKVVSITNGKIFSDSGDGVFVNRWTPNPAFSTSAVCSADALVGLLVIGRYGLAPLKYNQTGNVQTLGGSPPNSWIIRKYFSSIWMAGDPANPDVLTKSDTENPEEYVLGNADSFNVDLGDSDPIGITALSPPLYGRMYVGKWNSITEIQADTASFFINELISGIGIVSHNATVSTSNDIIFPSRRGIHSLKSTQNYGDVETTFISFPVHDIWNERVDFTKSQEMSAAFVPEYNSYLITFPRRSSDSFDILGFNIVTGDIFYWEDFNATFLTTFQDSNKRTRLLIGTKTGNIGLGRTIADTEFSDFLASFGSGFKTGTIFPGNQPKTVWSFKKLTIFYKPQGSVPIQVAYRIDNRDIDTVEIDQSGTGGTLLGEFILGSASLGQDITYTEVTKEIKGYGHSIQLDASVTPESGSESIGMEIYGYEVECEQVGDSTIPVSTS